MSDPRSVDAIDWDTWQAVDPATLVFIRRAGEILLIRKKRGLGAGKISAPGGRIEPGETPEACAIREVQEELLVTPQQLSKVGENRFQFVGGAIPGAPLGYSIHIHVFFANACHGTPTETDEAAPVWTALDAIPYDQMWDDDREWLPHAIAGRSFTGRFVFDGETMLDHHLEILP